MPGALHWASKTFVNRNLNNFPIKNAAAAFIFINDPLPLCPPALKQISSLRIKCKSFYDVLWCNGGEGEVVHRRIASHALCVISFWCPSRWSSTCGRKTLSEIWLYAHTHGYNANMSLYILFRPWPLRVSRPICELNICHSI